MFYETYLSSLCKRRSWPDPIFNVSRTGHGSFTCTVLVNDRLYTSGRDAESELAAKEYASCQAYILCRNFSQLDGMYPDRTPTRDGFIQGLPLEAYAVDPANYHSLMALQQQQQHYHQHNLQYQHQQTRSLKKQRSSLASTPVPSSYPYGGPGTPGSMLPAYPPGPSPIAMQGGRRRSEYESGYGGGSGSYGGGHWASEAEDRAMDLAHISLSASSPSTSPSDRRSSSSATSVTSSSSMCCSRCGKFTGPGSGSSSGSARWDRCPSCYDMSRYR